MFGNIRNLFQHDAPELIAEGQILEKPQESSNGTHRIEFKLDSSQGLIFRQEVTGLSVSHRRGDSVRVHYRISKEDPKFGEVSWIESTVQ